MSSRHLLKSVHFWLCARSRHYRVWHEHPRRHLHHRRIAAGAATAGLSAILISTIKYLTVLSLITTLVLPERSLAASQSWTSQSDWQTWTLAQTTAADNPGSVQLSATGVTGSWATETVSTPSWNHAGGTANGDAWVSNSTGTPATSRYTSGSWTDYGLPDARYVNDFDGASGSDVWAVGTSGLIVHFNGTSWSAATSPTAVTLHSVKVISASNAYAAGDSGVILHYNGTSWSAVAAEPVLGDINFWTIDASSATNIYAAGSSISSTIPKVVHSNGDEGNWDNITDFTATNGNVFDVFVTASYTYIMSLVTGSPDVRRWNGSAWTNLSVPVIGGGIIAAQLAGSSDNDIWATESYAGDPTYYHWNGSSWALTSRPTGPVPYDIWGNSGGTNYWVVTSTNTVDKFTASAVTYESSGTASITYTPSAGQFNDWTTATPTTTTPASTTATVEYSHDNATWVSDIATVPSSESLYIRVTLATSDTSVTPTLDDLTVNYTAITTTVSSPNGGETIYFNETGDTTTISWTATGTDGVDHIRLQYSTNSGGAWSDISGATALAAGTTSYAWNMPDASSSTVRVKVILENSSNAELDSDTSNADFTLTYDTTLPTFSSVSGTSDNADTTRGKSGNVVTVTFTASETLTANPTVTLGTQAMTFSSVVGLNYTYNRTLNGTETEGSAAIAISGTDLAGNAGTGSGSFTTDFTNPTFSSVSATSNNPDPTIGKSGNIVTLTFTASETLLANPTVTLGTRAMTFSSAVGLNYTYTRTLDGTETAGSSAIAISGSDLTSNAGTGSGSFTLDFTNPSISITSPSSNGTYTTGASSVAVSGSASDNNTLSTVTSSAVGAVTGTTSWSQTVSLSVGANSITYTATDSAGNTNTANIVITRTDNSGPGFNSIAGTSNNTNTSVAKVGDIVTITFTASETLLANPTVTLGGQAATFSSAVGLDYTYTRTITGTEAEGSATIAVSGLDVDSNPGSGSGSFTLDFTSPTFSSVSATSNNSDTSRGKVGNLVTITFTASEALSANPTVTLGGQTATYSTNSGLNYTYTRTLTGTETEGSAAIAISANDTASNPGTGSGSFTTDFTNPTFSAVAATSNNADPAIGKSGNTVTITFTASETLLANPTVTIGTKAATFSSLVGLNYTYTRTLDGTETAGSSAIAISGSDLASNAGTGSGSFTLDFTSPTFSSIATTSNNADTAIAKSGDIVTLTFTASETLLANPTVTIGTKTMTYSTNSGLNYTYTRTLDGTETEGSATISISASDSAGNTGTGSGSFTLDFTAPSISITSPSTTGSYTTRDSNQYLAGTASDSNGITAVSSSKAGTVSGTTSWSQTIALSEGSNSVTYTATDGAGHAASISFTVTRDSSRPAAPTTFDVTSCNTSSCSLAWGKSSAADRAGYLLVARTDSNFTAPTNGVNYSVTGNQNLGGVSYTWIDNGNTTTGALASLASGTLHYFAIYTVDSAYNYSDAKTTSGTTTTSTTPPPAATKPDPVQDLTTFVSSSNIAVRYRALPSGTIADIYRSTSSSDRGNKLTTTTDKGYEDATAQKGVTYYYTVIVRRTSDNVESDPRQTTGVQIKFRYSIGITLSPARITTRPGERVPLNVITYGSDGKPANLPYSFELDPKVGSVDSNNVFTAGANGDYRNGIKVKVQDGPSYSESYSDVYIESTNQIVSMALDPSSITLKPGASFQPKLNGTNQNGTVYSASSLGYSLSWSATGGSIDSNGRYTAGNNNGQYELKVTTTKGNEAWDIKGNITISNESPRLSMVMMTNNVRVTPGNSFRFFGYGYDQFANQLRYGPNDQIVFSNNDPELGAIDSIGVFHANNVERCSPGWNIRSDHTIGNIHYYILGHTTVAGYSNSETAANDNYRAIGISSYSWTIKPGTTQQFSGYVVDGWGRQVPHQALVFEILNPEAGVINANGKFTAGSKEGVYPKVLAISARNTVTGEVKKYGQYTLMIAGEDQVIGTVVTGHGASKPFTVTWTSLGWYNQFGLTYTGSRSYFFPSVTKGGGTPESPWMIETQGNGLFRDTIRNYQILGNVNGAMETRLGTLGIYDQYNLCRAIYKTPGQGGDDGEVGGGGGFIDDGGNPISYLGPGDNFLPGSRIEKLIKDYETKQPGGKEVISIETVRNLNPWQRLARNPVIQATAKTVAIAATALSAVLTLVTFGTLISFALSRLLELISQIISSLTNSLHGFAFSKRQRPDIGRVIDSKSRRPIANAIVSLINPQNKAPISSLPTDGLGRYQFMEQTGEAFLVRVEHPQYETQQLVLWNSPYHIFRLGQKIEFDETRLVNRRRWTKLFNLLDGFRLILLIAGTISTFILGLAGITVVVKFLIGYYIFAWMLEAYIRTKPRPYGVVVDAATKQPLDLVVVRVFTFADKLVRTIVTDQQGRFRTLMTPAYYRLTFTKVGWQPLSQHKYIGRSMQFLRIDAALTKNPAAPASNATGTSLGTPPESPVPPAPSVTQYASTAPVQTATTEQQQTSHDPQVDLSGREGALFIGQRSGDGKLLQQPDNQTNQPQEEEHPTDRPADDQQEQLNSHD